MIELVLIWTSAGDLSLFAGDIRHELLPSLPTSPPSSQFMKLMYIEICADGMPAACSHRRVLQLAICAACGGTPHCIWPPIFAGVSEGGAEELTFSRVSSISHFTFFPVLLIDGLT